MVSKIRELLLKLGAIHEEDVDLFASKTRDREIPVYRDRKSGVIFIEDFYVGLGEYTSGSYRKLDSSVDLQDNLDTTRRVNDFEDLCNGKKVLDWGCGNGNFLRQINQRGGAISVHGLELQDSFREALQLEGIDCTVNLRPPHKAFEICFMFHVLEHLPDPVASLQEIRASLDMKSGLLVVEVPHAKDFLLIDLDNKPFREFTLWSQHLILHTRKSLRLLLMESGFKVEKIYGVQRYGLSNHLQWLSKGRPGDHKTSLAALEDLHIKNAYASALDQIDATDTLVAIAKPI